MTEEHTIKTRVIVVSHGTGELSENENLLRVVDALSSKFTDVDVTPFRISTGKALSGFIAQNVADKTVIVPLLFSRGYFFTRKIEQEVARISDQHAVEVLPPVIEWPEFREMVGVEIGPDEFLGVAHGSKRSSASREAAEQFFSSVAGETGGKVRCGFLEEPPLAVDVAKEMDSANRCGLIFRTRATWGT